MHILVTGGAGYVGSHVCKALATSGFHPIVLDDLRRGHRSAVQWGPLVVGDCGDPAVLGDVFGRFAIKAVMHFAALAYVGESIEAPDVYFRNNVMATINLLDAMKSCGIQNIIFSSSCATYGIPSIVPITEDHPQKPINPYGESKLMVERILYWYGLRFGMSWSTLRYFNAAGADPDCEIGENHDPEPHLLPRALATAAGLLPCLDILGDDYETPDGTAIRDYTHVTDLAHAHVLALRYLMSGGTSDAFNLGTGNGSSVLDVKRAVESVVGASIPVSHQPRRPGDPPKLVADPSKARRVLGWEIQYSDLPTIVETAWRWYRRNATSATQPAVQSNGS